MYVGINLLAGLDGTGLGFFSGFVAVCALVFSWISFDRSQDNAFGVIWLHWALLWGLFFLVLGRGRTELTRFTGAVAALQGWVTGAVPAFLLLTGNWAGNTNVVASALAVFGVVVYGVLYPRLRSHGVVTLPDQPPASEPADTTTVNSPTTRSTT